MNDETLPEVLARRRAGQTLREIQVWLESIGQPASIGAIHKLVNDLGELAQAAAGEQAAALDVPIDVEVAPGERLRNLRHAVAEERRAARLGVEEDWKRYHSALKLTFELIKQDLKPAPSEKPAAGAAVGAPAAAPEQPEIVFICDGKEVDLSGGERRPS